MDINSQLTEAIFTMSRLMKDQMSRTSQAGNLTIVQLQTLVFLKQHPHVPMSEIANYFKIELPSATSLINKLVREKLVTRKLDPKDRRLVRITLTDKGKNLLTQGMKERSRKIEKNLSYLSQEDKTNLLAILKKMIEKMEEQYEK